jgi:hypothetical protein
VPIQAGDTTLQARHYAWMTPKRFEVRFRSLQGSECSHRVVTYMDEAKAVAMAAVNHTYHHEELGMYEVLVGAPEPIDRDEAGVYRLDDEDVTDRYEW